MKDPVSIVNETGMRIPRLPVLPLKKRILGAKYSLAVVFIGDKKSQALNKEYRKKNKPTNILSFAISKHEGELYINPRLVKREQKIFGRNFKNLLAFLLIHGMFHLKGYDHGSKMEAQEKAARIRFKI